MKKIILLLAVALIIIGLKIDVYAATYTDMFYISDIIDGIYYAKEKGGQVEYRKAKFKRRRDDNKIVYCIEPFVDMPEDTSYNGYDYNYEKLLNLSKEDWETVRLLSYYGYGYPGHTEEKWYPITQLLIWETVDKDATFYYTQTYKGTKITRFTNEIKELKLLVENHDRLPSFANAFIKMSINSSLMLEDNNNVLNNYSISNTENLDIHMHDNQLVINTDDVIGEVEVKLTKKDTLYNTIPVIYTSDYYQNMLLVGGYNPISTSFKLDIGSGDLKIIKHDADTNSTIPQGEAQITGTTYELYDDNNKLIDKIIINEIGEGTLTNLKYGDYKLKETISGKDYKLHPKTYYFNINAENKSIILNLTNEVIKSNVRITKYLNENNKIQLEKNIKFAILNHRNELYKEVETDENGIVEFELPYGTYLVKQINTTDGYYKVDDFSIVIDENSNSEISYYLHDLKIPDTNEFNYNKFILITLFSTITLWTLLRKYETKNN